MNLTNTSVFQFYEGTDSAHYTDLTGQNLNAAAKQLLANDNALKGAVDGLEDNFTGNDAKNALAFRGLTPQTLVESMRQVHNTVSYDGIYRMSTYHNTGNGGSQSFTIARMVTQTDWGASVMKVTIRDIYYSGSTSEHSYFINTYYGGFSIVPIGDSSPDLLTFVKRGLPDADGNITNLIHYANTDDTHNPNGLGYWRTLYCEDLTLNISGNYNGYRVAIEIQNSGGDLRGKEDYSIVSGLSDLLGDDTTENTTDGLSNSISFTRGIYLPNINVRETREARL